MEQKTNITFPTIVLLFSIALTVFTVAALDFFLPGFLSGMLLGSRAATYPFTFQTVMWFPFCLGFSILVLRVDRYFQNIKLSRYSYESEIESFETLEDLHNDLEYLGKFDQSPEVSKYLYGHTLEAVTKSSRYHDVKNEIVSSSELLYIESDSVLSRIKYITWLLPSLGFMGTVYGISISVSKFGTLSPDDPEMLSKIASTLSVAFDTTLLSLIQSSILVLILTFVENLENDFIAKSTVRFQKLGLKILRSVEQDRNLKYKKAS